MCRIRYTGPRLSRSVLLIKIRINPRNFLFKCLVYSTKRPRTKFQIAKQNATSESLFREITTFTPENLEILFHLKIIFVMFYFRWIAISSRAFTHCYQTNTCCLWMSCGTCENSRCSCWYTSTKTKSKFNKKLLKNRF